MLVGLFGILKAGGTYVPIDVSYPEERIAYILKDSNARVVLTDGSRPGLDITTLAQDGETHDPWEDLDADRLAYVIYTSGSTGRPKGTMVSHGALAHYLEWAVEAYRVADGSRSLVHSSVSFDATITSLFTPLLVGGAVELIPEERAVASLARALASDHAYSLVKITPAHLDLLRHELGDSAPQAQVGAFVIGGEALLDSTLAWWRRAAPRSRLINEYGPTETVVGCAVFEDRGGSGSAAVPIGRPIDRMQVHVLDADVAPVPVGTPGEIFIGGAGVARGYLGRPELTAERFLPDPFAVDAGARMYRTGDLGRWRPDGELEYLGRNDLQVKIRGHRVEIGEVEAVLSEHPSITEAAVVARRVGTTHELIAFLVGADATLESLRTFVARRLPEPLVPGRFVVLHALPLTPNGKVDRQSLLDLEAEALRPSSSFVAPRTDAEKVLAKIWETVLHRTQVGVSEDYFATGGDSLKALQIVSRAAREGWRLRVRDVFDFPTIAELARHVGRGVATAEQRAVAGEVLLTPIQRWFFEDHPGPYHHFNQSVFLRWRGRVDTRILSEALSALADHHDALRMRFTALGAGEWRPEHLSPGVVVEAVEARDATEAGRIQASLDPAEGQLVRAAVVRGADADRVLIVIHHLVIDGVSWRLLLEDLDTVYWQRVTGLAVRLPAKTESFREWARQLAAYASSATALAERSYWQGVVEHATALPMDGPAQTGPPETIRVGLDRETTELLLGGAHRAYRTQANDLLLTGLAMALEASFGARRSLVAVEGHGRHEGLDTDVSRTVGWFTSRYPVRLDLVDGDVRARIRHVKEELRRVPARGFGYGVLRYLGEPDTRVGLACRPAIGFNYLGRFDVDSTSRLFDVTDDPTGAVVDPRWTRDHAFEVIATVFGDRLEIRVESTRGCFRPERVQVFADAYASSLRQIADHCASRAGEPTPSDLTCTGLDIATFDALLQRHGLSPDSVEDILPLSPMQEGFLVHSLYGRPGAYFEQSTYRLSGRVEPALFEDAWNRLLVRHQNLRVAYWHEDVSRPVQVVLRHRRVEFRFEDWRGLEPSEQGARLSAFRQEERRRGFDLTSDPLVRVALFQVGDTSFDAVWGFPHLLLDGWSAGILLGELLAIYAEIVGGRHAELPEPVPYRRYLQWLDRQDREASIRFWERYLEGYDETASIPAEHRATPRETYEPVSVPWSLGADETRRLKELAARMQVTLSTAIQTLWAILLASYTERDDVIFGATVSGRPEALPGVERMVGLFINTVPVRVRISRMEGFSSIAKRVQAEGLAGQSHAACPLAQIQAGSVLKSRVFDHILVFENYPLDRQLRELGSLLTVESSDVFEQVHYDLALLVADATDRVDMRFIANGAMYPGARLTRVGAHFEELTRGVLADPDRPVWQHALLPEAERRQLAAFNATPGAPLAGVTLVDLLDQQAARTPEAVALIHGGERLTYAVLHARADQLARTLRRRGIGPESLVGVYLRRRPDLIVALLAVLKAGGAYVPLDPNYPADRLRFLLDDARVALVVTEQALRPGFPAKDYPVLCVDGPLPARLNEVEDQFAPLVPGNLAYIIYTSGSTGTPKGAAISHAAAAALVEWGRHTYSPDDMRGVLASTSICFDLSVFEIFVTLSTGGAMVLAENALELPTLDAALDVTLVNTVPSAIAELVRRGGLPPSVRTVNLAGEPLQAPLVDALYAVPTIRRVCDLYGPSEDTTYSTYALRERGGPETIGGPLTHTHTEIHLLDKRLEKTPISVAGEIYIASDKLSRGYLHRPALTAERFVPNPWSTDGGRMYRTGDRARYRNDGSLEFLGRLDHQVKVRGFRIELGEIESALTATRWVRDTAVIAREDVPGDRYIVAYVVPADGAPADDAPYRERLAQKLPDYMVPARFVFLTQLPRTPNGKLDRRSLPKPDDTSSAESIEPPRNELDAVIAGIWREALGVERAGIFDNFFEHGGHSLKAARMVSRARHEHGLDLSLRDLFTYPTIAGLADQVASRRRVARARIPAVAAAADYALSYGQRRLWVLEQLRSDGPAAYNVPAAFLVYGPLNTGALEQALHTVIQRHEVLRTCIVVVDGEPRQHVSPAVDFHLDVADLSKSDRPRELFEEDVRRLAHAPFDLAHAPLVRVALRTIGSDVHGLAVVIHHIATDGWSIPILMRELMVCYQDAREGRTPDLPLMRVQYRDYAAWQRAQVDADSIASHRDYWRRVFADESAPLTLPIDAPRPAVQTFDGSRFRFDLDAELAAHLRALSVERGASLFMMLLAGMNVLLARISGQNDVTVGSPMAGRTHPDLDDQIGYYVNTVPLRTMVRNGERFVDLLERTRDVVAAAFEHQAYPFDRLVDDVRVTRDLARSPLFDVMVAMETTARADLALAGLRVEPLGLDYRVSKFDLTTTFLERGADAGIEVVFEYNTALFLSETIQRLARRFESLARAIVRQPNEAVDRLSVLPDEELRAVADRWNWERLESARGRSLTSLFEEQVVRTPDALAVVCGARRLSYAELDEWANAVAQRLVTSHAVRPEEPVGLMVDASDWMIVGLLGILKAGAAYVPLDPTYPRDRNDWIEEDAGIRVVVASDEIPALRDGLARVDPARVSGRCAKAPARDDTDEALAYLLYTSGSTGRPKGVAVSHRGVVNLLADCQRRKPILAGAGCALWTNCSFDVSVYQIFSSLVAGGRLHIATSEMRSDPRAYFEWMAREHITSAYVAPFQLEQLRGFLSTARAHPPLSRLLVGVEPIEEQLLASIRALVPGLHIINGYGPTEASICATLYDVPDAAPPRVTPIGRAVANTGAYVVDRHLQPVGFGVTGEIVLAGDGLARGYHGDPAATAEAFVPSPFGPTPGGRLYRTGDRGWRLPDGNLVFAGRIDHQVKIRGHRVEIGEVERALRAHAAVADAAVVDRAAGSTRELVAFLVPVADEPSVESLRSFLGERLPGYMIPARYVVLDALPLTPTGKLDRRALADRDGRALRARGEHVAPRNPREIALARIWMDVLVVARVGVHDNYFALGGDSIKAIQIAARANAHGLSLTIRDLFSRPTVAELARTATGRIRTAGQGPVTGGVPLTAIQEWFFREHAGPYHHFNQAVLLRWKERVGEEALRAAVSVLIEHHDALRSHFTRTASGAWTQTIGATAEMTLTTDDLRDLAQKEAVIRMERRADELHARLDLDAGRLVAGGLFRLPDGDRVLLVIHHLVVDGVSWRILLEDLDLAYRTMNDGGRPPQLPPKTDSFKDWAEAARLSASGRAMEAERDYWSDVCGAAPEPWAPGAWHDAPRTGESRRSASERHTLYASLESSDTRVLLAAADATGGAGTLHLLLAGLACGLRDGLGRSRTMIDLEGHGRESSVSDLDVGRTVGWFTSLYPFMLDAGDSLAAGDAALRSAIEIVGQSLQRLPHKGVGYGLLRYFGDGPAAGLTYRADVGFNYLGQFDQDASSRGFEFASESSGRPVHPRWPQTHVLDVSAHVEDRRFKLSVAFNPARITREQGERLLDAYVGCLRQIAAMVGDDADGISPYVNRESNASFERPEGSIQSEVDSAACEPAGRERAGVLLESTLTFPLSWDEFEAVLRHGRLERSQVEDVLPLAPMQEAIVFHERREPGNQSYVQQVSLELRGPLHREAFAAAWQTLAKRHEALRVRIAAGGSRPLQIVLREPGFTYQWLERADLETLRAADRRLDLEHGPLWRVSVVETAPDIHEMIWTFSHVLLDGWCFGILFEELGELYAAFASDREPSLPRPERLGRCLTWLESRDSAGSRNAFAASLAGFSEPTGVPRDGIPRDAISGSPGAAREPRQHVFVLDEGTTAGLQSLAADAGVTLGAVLQAVWVVLLSRYNQTTDVLYGLTVSGRPPELPGALRTIGCFINTLPIRVRVEPEHDLGRLARAVQDSVLGLQEHQHLPLAEIQSLSPLRSSLLDHVFVFENYPWHESVRDVLPGVTVGSTQLLEQLPYDFGLICALAHGRLHFRLHFNRTAYSAERIAAVARHLENICTRVVAAPGANLRVIDVMDDAERTRIVVEWNRTAAPLPEARTIVDVFDQRCRRTPDRVALLGDEPCRSYADVNRQANRIARTLGVPLGVRLDEPVGICLPRSMGLVTAILGILKSGGAYLPLDPGLPAARVRALLADSRVKCVLTDAAGADKIGRDFRGTVVDVDQMALEADEIGSARPAVSSDEPSAVTHQRSTVPHPHSLAYVMYTSGSTGQPKGVLIQHESVVNRLNWMQRACPLDSSDVLLQKTPFGFDVSVWELLWWTFSGASLAVLPQGSEKDPAAIVEAVHRHGVTTLHFVPSMLDAFLAHVEEHGAQAELASLRRVFVSGEELLGRQIQRFRDVLGVPLLNLYGPTEATVDVSCFDCREWDGGRVPIGRPIDNTRLFVLDPTLTPLPIGVAGEIAIGGMGLARGYLGNPALTADRFRPDPFGVGTRVYRTGDRGRFDVEGQLHFLGRSDAQVKVRGQRVEPGEIEFHLLAQPGVRQAAVRLVDGDLIGYVVGEVDGLRARLREVLPEALVPSLFVRLDALPLTASGKLDRRALPDPERGQPQEMETEPARDGAERAVMGAFAAVLGREVGREESFFDAGGHSLKALRVASRLGRDLGIEVSLRELFAHPTAEGLAAVVRGRAPARFAPIARTVDAVDFPASHAQRRIWVLVQMGGRYHVPGAVRLRGDLDRERLVAAIRCLVDRHDALRTCFAIESGELRQRVDPDVPVNLRVADLRELREERDVATVVREESERAFDLDRGPLMRVALLERGERDIVLVLTLHHIVSDAWSVGVLLRELMDLYAGGELPALSLQYRDYAVWQRGLLDAGAMTRHQEYWRTVFEEEVPVLDVPADHPRPLSRSFAGDRVWVEFGEAELTGLKELGRRAGASLFMTLLALVKVLLYRYTGQCDVAVGTAVSGRERAELEGLVGLFVNTVVLRDRLTGDEAFERLLARVRETALLAYEHQAYPFDVLVEEVGARADLLRNPLFDVMVGLAEAAPELALDGVNVEPVPLESTEARFDLTFAFAELQSGLGLSLEYSTELFERARVERMGEHLRTLVSGVLADASQPVGRLPLLTQAEMEATRRYSGVPAASASSETVLDLFARQVDRAPDALAARCGPDTLTYRALNEQANALAHHLRGLGVGPEVRVAFCLPPSLDAIVAVLGILKAGGAYVPLDPDLPSARLDFLLADTSPAIVIAREPLATPHPVCRFGAWPAITRPLPDRPAPANAAYVLYTSGSTGQPKGVVVEHASLAHYLQWAAAFYGAGDFPLFTSLGVDLTVTSLFLPLVLGRAVHVAAGNVSDALLYAFGSGSVDCVKLTPSHISLLASLELTGTRVRLAVVGGEALSRAHVLALRALNPQIRIVNEYGPTEVTVGCVAADVGADVGGDVAESGHSCIGQPIIGAQVWVLGRDGELVPEGVWGELYVAGPCLARGYLGRPDLTIERFVRPDVLGGERCYRTGDKVRFMRGGVLEYAGRFDDQVKVRGHRVELGEIEFHLSAQAGVERSAVVLRDDELVAYVVGATDGLQQRLRDVLPAALVPSRVVGLNALPLLPSGKLDRRALPAPTANETAPEVFARDPAERVVLSVFAQVLGRTLARSESFFDAGGHSLKAIQAVSRLKRELGVDVSLRDIFAHPTAASMAVVLRGLAPARFATIERVADAVDYGVSHAQRRMWVLVQMGGRYGMPGAVRLRGEVDIERLRDALRGVVERHESLRTRFSMADAELRQRVEPNVVVNLRIADLQGDADPETRAQEMLLAEASQDFDLEQGPLVRVLLIELGSQDRVLMLSVHHIVADGWSVRVLLREVMALYAGTGLPPLEFQYRDYAAWQRHQLDAGSMRSHREYWLGVLAGELRVLELPTDHPRPEQRSFAGARIDVGLDAAERSGLIELGNHAGATLFMTLLALVKVLLYRYTGQRDVIVGSPVSGRQHPALEGQVGLYVNTVVLRDRVHPDKGFARLLPQVRETAVLAYQHEVYPLDLLVEEVSAPRDLGRNPLFDVMVLLAQPEGDGEPTVPQVEISGFPVESRESRFDLTFVFGDEGSVLGLSIEYSTELFERERVERMSEHFRSLVRSVLADPSRPVGLLSMLTPMELGHLDTAPPGEWPASSDLTVVDLFAAQVSRTPDRLAVVDGERTLTYRDLDARANGVARHLGSNQIGPGHIVAVACSRSEWIVVACLGILKAGAAYLPLDPTNPSSRLAEIVVDSGARFLLTDRPHESGLDVTTVPAAAFRSLARVQQDDLAYVIYTSGSTGRPKGVAVEHGAFANMALAQIANFGITPADRIAQFASPSFDASLYETFLALLSGASLAIVPEAARSDARGFLEWLERDCPSVLVLPPSFLRALDQAPLDGVRLLVTAGESANADDARHYGRSLRSINAYGPTEFAVCATLHEVGTEGSGPIPIGRPIANTTAYVLDDLLQVLPVGVPGELYLGGTGVARGYLGRPDLTAERFVPDPFTPGGRLFRSGDRAVRNRDGTLHFLGRLDEQIKLRGYRIEPGEIEHAIREHPDVSHAVVIERGGELLAYVVGRTAGLREHLLGQLPSFMVPGRFVPVERLPLTSSGKIDRRALPDPQYPAAATVARAPRDQTERCLLTIFTEVLAATPGLDDDFFLNGGHSLGAMQVASRVRRDLGVDLPLRAVFLHPTVSALADIVRSLAPLRWAPIPALPPAPDHPASHAQRRLWVLARLGGGYALPGAILIAGPIDRLRLQLAVRALLDRHESLRTRFVLVDAELRQRVDPVPDEALRCVALSGEAEAQTWLREDVARGFDLERGPLARVTLLELAPDRSILAFVLHHAIADAWSMDLLVGELTTLYAGGVLPAPRIRYRDYAVWQGHLLASGALDADRQYWHEQLGGELPILELPTDDVRPAVRRSAGGIVRTHFDQQDLAGLEALGRRANASLFMTLLAVVKVLLYRYTGQSDIIVGSPVAGRSRPELEDQVGLFVSTVALRDRVRADESFDALLRRVRDTAIAAYEHEAYPFDLLVDELAVARDLGRSPIFDVTMALQEAPSQTLSLGGAELRSFPLDWTESKFDLSFSFARDRDRLSVEITYSRDLFVPERVARLANHLQCLVKSLLRDPSRPVATLAIESPTDRRAPKSVAFPREQTVVSLFEEQARRTPDGVAVIQANDSRARDVQTNDVQTNEILENRRLSYADLNARANGVARFLREVHAVDVEDRVGVCLERSEWLIVAALGVLKAGAAYVPIPVDAGPMRTAQILADSDCRVVLGGPDAGHGWIDVSRIAPGDQQPAAPVRTGQPCLRHLHLRLERSAQRRSRAARLAREPGVLACVHVRTRSPQPRDAVRQHRVRRLGVGNMALPVARRLPVPARRRTEAGRPRDFAVCPKAGDHPCVRSDAPRRAAAGRGPAAWRHDPDRGGGAAPCGTSAPRHHQQLRSHRDHSRGDLDADRECRRGADRVAGRQRRGAGARPERRGRPSGCGRRDLRGGRLSGAGLRERPWSHGRAFRSASVARRRAAVPDRRSRAPRLRRCAPLQGSTRRAGEAARSARRAGRDRVSAHGAARREAGGSSAARRGACRVRRGRSGRPEGAAARVAA